MITNDEVKEQIAILKATEGKRPTISLSFRKDEIDEGVKELPITTLNHMVKEVYSEKAKKEYKIPLTLVDFEGKDREVFNDLKAVKDSTIALVELTNSGNEIFWSARVIGYKK